MQKTITVLIVDDHPIVRDGLSTILGLREEIEVVGTASRGQTALQMAAQMKPDVILMDLYMPDMNGIEATKQIKKNNHHSHILILTSHLDEEIIMQALFEGVSGFLLKDWETEDIVNTIKSTLSGQLILPASISSKLSNHLSKQYKKIPKISEDDVTHQVNSYHWDQLDRQLSFREKQIIVLMLNNYGNIEIAQMLHLSVGTVKNYVSSIYKTLNVTNRNDAIDCLKNRYGF